MILMTAFADAEDAVAGDARGRARLPAEAVRDGGAAAPDRPRPGRARVPARDCRAGVDRPRPQATDAAATPRPCAALRDRIEAAAASDVAVLVTGETGTGKDLCARGDPRAVAAGRGSPFVVVNCAAIPETLLESELFGHEKGAFTGADRRRVGRFEAADGGTLFLDEIGELSPAQPGEAPARASRPPRSSRSARAARSTWTSASSRRPTATSRGEIARGAFRKDLYYRLNVIDIADAAAARAARGHPGARGARSSHEIAARQGRPVPELEPGGAGRARRPRLARQRARARARARAGGRARLEADPSGSSTSRPTIAAAAAARGVGSGASRRSAPKARTRPLGEAVEKFEREYIRRVLERTGGHRGRAAALLGISRKSLWERLRELTSGRRDGPGKA